MADFEVTVTCIVENMDGEKEARNYVSWVLNTEPHMDRVEVIDVREMA